jgi:hypothetical protein
LPRTCDLFRHSIQKIHGVGELPSASSDPRGTFLPLRIINHASISVKRFQPESKLSAPTSSHNGVLCCDLRRDGCLNDDNDRFPGQFPSVPSQERGTVELVEDSTATSSVMAMSRS